ncbi:RNA polymerase subunit sigma-24 [Bacillus sp. FJAT-27264]|uniref:sigma-70 family RNA polymerase sigma factor n=1 Tax=Paenibacillus sp. (strain DSM 101736 / FJAT-27264) TaxID=1850362 RepID=UPI0008080F05|nr:sigma-70 family RNA polymerase sigma factor [Bacillus sp. FJAT-27264]OBZ11874.1 RNA polymerase subunit sigma-24 [Bacillus sp. FJAT-27264]
MTTQIKTTVQNFNIESMTPIFNFVLKGVRHEDREEVRSEAVLRVLTAINGGKIKKDVFTFAHTVVQRTVYDHYRRNNRLITKNSTSVNFCDGADEEHGSTIDYFSYATVDVGFGLSDVKNDYLNNISEFTTQERKIMDFMLFTEEGMDMKPTEISNMLGINKSHASRAMNKLKKVCQA